MALNFPIQEMGGATALDILESYQIIATDGRGTANRSFFSLSVLDSIRGPPMPCAEQSFGFDGQYTDTVCESLKTMIDLCGSKEPGCDPLSFQKIQAGKPSIFRDNQPVVSLFFCLAQTAFNVEACTPVPEDTNNAVIALFTLIGIIPDGWNNLLISNTIGDTTKWAIFGVDVSDPNSHYVIGDGYFKLNELVFKNAILESIDAKIASGIKMTTFQYRKDTSFLNDADSLVFQDALEGYFMQKYASDLFTPEEREMVVNFTQMKSETGGCGHVIGILTASKCGYNAAMMHSFWDSFPTGVCSGLTKDHYAQAHNKMVKDGKKSKKGGKNKKMPNYSKCLKKLKLTKGPKEPKSKA
jgi:hypothetical protein